MKKTIVFAKRNLIEVARDPLSWIFCAAFPIVMLIIMTIVNSTIPKEAGQTLFRLDNLSGGIAIFGQMFVMLFTALAVAKDRGGAFLTRLYSSPMKSRNFVFGYLLPMIGVAFVQVLLSFASSVIISKIVDTDISIGGLLLTAVVVMPSALMFSAIGLLFGTIFNDKAAPGLCSIIISVGAMLGGIWFDIEGAGGIMFKIGRCLPFFYSTKLARASITLDFGFKEFVVPFLVTILSAIVLTVLGSIVFCHKMRADQR
ncbi:MAG: ABC transporter permease [Clostridiales bacterium]|nr:ABC transporter permease [Clostridiales bacterium]